MIQVWKNKIKSKKNNKINSNSNNKRKKITKIN